MDLPVILYTLSYLHDQLFRLVSKKLIKYNNSTISQNIPISVLISTDSFREYDKILLSSRFKSTLCRFTSKLGNISALRWARDHGCPWDESTCSVTAYHGHMDLLRWLRSQDCPWDLWTCTFAAGSGNLGVLQWARSEGCPWNSMACVNAAAGSGHVEVLEWIQQTSEGCQFGPSTCSEAARYGQLGTLQWLRSQGCLA